MKKRYSRKRESILQCLQDTKEHPGAEWVYKKLKPMYPDLSLATVYRNMNELVEEGKLCSVGVVLDKERFDARTEPHTHAICARCGKILDVDEIALTPDMAAQIQSLPDFTVAYSQLQLIGLCAECQQNSEGKENDR